MDAQEIRGEAYIQQRRIRRELARVLLLVAVGGEEIGAVGRAIEGDFALGAAADRADGLGFGGAEAARFTFLTDRTGQEAPLVSVSEQIDNAEIHFAGLIPAS